MIEFQPVSDLGQLEAGQLILIEHNHKGKTVVSPAVVQKVIASGTNDEEVIIDMKSNSYFNMSMYLDGQSWVKNVQIIINGKVFSITNTKEKM